MFEPRREFEHGYTCSQVVELATEYVGGTMPAELVEPFEMHLNFCDGCFTFVEQIRTTSALAARVSEEEIPEDMKANLVAAFRDWRRR